MPRSPITSTADLSETPSVSKDSDKEDTDDSEDEILEISENGRWQKIDQHVTRDVPGIDAAFLAIDTDDAVEFVWNEVRYSNRKVVKESKERLVKILKRLTEVKHNNIVNFIDFWHDRVNNQDRLVFITEYMTSGSLMQFLMKAKGQGRKKTVSKKMWRRWCRQILSALSYLHKHDITHGNLSLASIFIQHDGLVKIGSVSPDAIHEHVKTKREEMSMRPHYTAPEYAEGPVGTAADIYAFGMCALEMLNFDLLGNGENPSRVKKESIHQALHGLTGPQQEFVDICLRQNKEDRPSATTLLKHPALQEVFDLKILSALALSQRVSREKIWEELDQSHLRSKDKDSVMAELHRPGRDPSFWKLSQSPQLDLEKLFEEITLDVIYHTDSHPLTTRSPQKKDVSSTRTMHTSNTSSQRNSSQYAEEIRKVTGMCCNVNQLEDKREIVLKLTFEDKMERELTSELKNDDDASALAWDLVMNGLVNESDQQKITETISQKLLIVAVK
ncbi:nuclear receptor-binding protein-like [Halichondria panicea]|uniref:nuclear receptor-binding protein-like n=1 Tax=Halichondria panicea TaxID=6063 RepID=UPI00312BBE27